MKKILIISALLGTVLASPVMAAPPIKVTSTILVDGKTMPMNQVFDGFGCTGKNISPDLAWESIPKETKYFAVTAYDPDAPTGSGWWHWQVINIPLTTQSLKMGAGNAGGPLPEGAIQTRNDFGTNTYGGACPPVGDKPHHYIFTVYALKDKVPVAADASGAMTGYYLHSLALAEGHLTVTYGR